jgi:hypothetical protein
MPQQRCKRRERRQVGPGIGRQMCSGAGGPLEHPCWNLKPTVGIRPGQITAENNAVRLLDRCENADPKTKPRMPPVLQFTKLSSVGVSKPRCTTAAGHTRALTDAPPIKPTSSCCRSARQLNGRLIDNGTSTGRPQASWSLMKSSDQRALTFASMRITHPIPGRALYATARRSSAGRDPPSAAEPC